VVVALAVVVPVALAVAKELLDSVGSPLAKA